MYTTRGDTGTHTNKPIHAASRRCLSGLARQNTHSVCSMQQIHGVGERPLSPGRLRTSLRIKSDKRAAPRHAHGLDQEKQRATHAARE